MDILSLYYCVPLNALKKTDFQTNSTSKSKPKSCSNNGKILLKLLETHDGCVNSTTTSVV